MIIWTRSAFSAHSSTCWHAVPESPSIMEQQCAQPRKCTRAACPASRNQSKPEERHAFLETNYSIVKAMLLEVSAEVPPPYIPPETPGFVTVTCTGPAVIAAESGIVTVI